MASRAIENYIKKLYMAQQESPRGPVAMGRLANLVGVVPGTATAMVKALADAGLVKYSPRTGVRLTAAGNQLALHVLRRHRIVELFLVKIVGLDWSEVHDEAEELEHVISERLLARMDLLLGHPKADPHGDPIPSATGQLVQEEAESFVTCAADKRMEITRVLDQEPRFLQFVDQCGLVPGTRLHVRQRNEQADSVAVEVEGKKLVTLSTSAAAKFLVRRV